MPHQHNTLIDWLRALAIVMVATVHTWSLARIDASVHPTLALCYRLFYQCGVPLFVMISGALQLSSPIVSIRQFYCKRYKRILIPFLIWGTMVYVVSCVVGKYSEVHSIWDGIIYYIPFLLTNRINEAYWFIGLIVMLYAITPFLQRAIATLSDQSLVMLCGIWLVYVLLRRFFPSVYLLEYTSRLTYFVGFYLVGYVAYKRWGWLWQPKTNSIILAVSQSSYTTYLMHMLLISPLYMLIGFSGETTLWKCALYPILTALIVVGACTIMAIICKRIFKRSYKYLGIN